MTVFRKKRFVHRCPVSFHSDGNNSVLDRKQVATVLQIKQQDGPSLDPHHCLVKHSDRILEYFFRRNEHLPCQIRGGLSRLQLKGSMDPIGTSFKSIQRKNTVVVEQTAHLKLLLEAL